ncbi:MAG: hypothetical protein JRG75_01850 [Deltaproteobacteria bacterium]|nr:hypothetical protein [Deltaproteobacteria bacterium]
MAEEIQGEFLIVGYVDAIEEAVHDGKKKGIPEDLINDMYGIHGDIVEVEPFLVDQEDYDDLTKAVGELVTLLAEKCRAGDAGAAREIVDQLRKNVDGLREDLME